MIQTYRTHCAWLGDPDASVLGYTYGSNYFLDCENYLKQFFGENFTTAELDKSAAESHFRSRMDRDKRYKNEKQIQAGLEDEYERLNALRDAYVKVQGWLPDDTLSPREAQIPVSEATDDAPPEHETWVHAFDLRHLHTHTNPLPHS